MSEVLERGDIFFFYRPRVGVEQVRSLDDVQRFFVVLRPDDAAPGDVMRATLEAVFVDGRDTGVPRLR